MKEKNRGVSPQLNSSSNSAVTQPVGDARNVRRNQQIKALHLQFQDLKKKIKDVESKNQKIIQNIHKQYDFKKKPTNSQYSIQPPPIVHYDQHNQKSHITITDKNPSDHSDGESRPRQISKKMNIKKNAPSFHQSVEYRKTQNFIDARDESEMGSKANTNQLYRPPIPVTMTTPYQYSAGSQYVQPQQQFQVSQFNGINPYQVPIQFSPNYNGGGLAMSQAGSFYGQNNYQLQEALKREREKIKILESTLEQRQGNIVDLKKIQKKYTLLSTNYSETVELCLEQFFSQVVEKRLYEMEKYVKKNENKLKKIQLKLKDHQEHQRSQKNILQHRSKRSSSRSKKQASPSQNYQSITSMPRVPSSKKGRDSFGPQESTSKSKQSESKSSQQFDQIATQYQEIIRIKTKEVEAYEVRFRQKEKELIQMTAKCAKLQMKIADISNSNSKSRRTSEKDQNLLSGIQSSNEKQVISLDKRINELQQALQVKQKQLSLKESLGQKNGKKLTEYENKLKKNELQISKLKEECKRIESQRKTQSSTSSLVNKLQSDLQLKERQFSILKQKSVKLQSQKIQKECQNLTFINKIKKIQSLLAVKEEKIGELQKIIQSSVGGEAGGDLLQKSMYLQKMDHNDLQNLQEQKQKLQDQLIKQRQQIFIITKNNENLHAQLTQQQEGNQRLKKQIQSLLIQNESMRINIKAQSFQKYQVDTSTPLKTLLQESDALSEDEEDHHQVKHQLEQLKSKHEETQKALKLQNQKTFEENRKVLKLTSQLKYFKEQLAQREEKYQKLRRQYEQGRYQINSLTHALQQKQSELEVQRKVNAQKIKQIQTQWLQFEQEVKNNNLDVSHDNQHNELRSSRHLSEESFVNYRNTYNNVNAENQRLMQKLKQLQKVVEVQKEMEDKIVNQYRNNVQKIKAQLREKNKENQRVHEENQNFKRKVRILEQNESRLKSMIKGEEEQNLLGNSSQKIMELQIELNQMRQINSRLEAVEQELFNQITEKEKQLEGLLNVLTSRDKRIEELQDIVELKEMNLGSHISTSQNKSKVRQSLQSQSSLRYSVLSNRDKTMELQLSEAGQSFFEHNQSMMSNVSQVFGREEFPYQKMQLKRVEQRRLFEKTAAYIKSLKNSIEEKNKKIKLLQRKIESLRNSELIRKDIYQIQQSNLSGIEADSGDIFKDYYSVQLSSSHSQRYKFKQLQHQAKLTIEQNNLLNKQIQSMQEQLFKAEQQEDSLMKLKDLYKDEIKNLIKQNQDQIKVFEDQVKKERLKVQQSQSIQKMQAIKQIFLKIVNTFVAVEAEIGRPKKKEQKKKELQDYLKVCCNLMNLQSSIRQQMSASIREMKR